MEAGWGSLTGRAEAWGRIAHERWAPWIETCRSQKMKIETKSEPISYIQAKLVEVTFDFMRKTWWGWHAHARWRHTHARWRHARRRTTWTRERHWLSSHHWRWGAGCKEENHCCYYHPSGAKKPISRVPYEVGQDQLHVQREHQLLDQGRSKEGDKNA